MGYNSTILIMNDAMVQIEKDPKSFWENAFEALMDRRIHNQPVDFSIGNHSNGGLAISNTHADCVQVIAVGGNYASIIGSTFWGNQGHHEEEQQIKLLNDILNRKGYKVVKTKGKS